MLVGCLGAGPTFQRACDFASPASLAKIEAQFDPQPIHFLNLDYQSDDDNVPNDYSQLGYTSHYANFSSEFISPDKYMSTTPKRTPKNADLSASKLNISNNGLDTSGATTLAQQSAFEKF